MRPHTHQRMPASSDAREWQESGDKKSLLTALVLDESSQELVDQLLEVPLRHHARQELQRPRFDGHVLVAEALHDQLPVLHHRLRGNQCTMDR